jgi:type II secretory ATPase GspE/PulE/Tfp pilus assembly ATPase PilB-like protein
VSTRRTPPPAVAATPSDRATADVVRLVERLVADALTVGASDVHVEAGEEAVRVRHRVDGVLRDVELLPRAVGLPLVSRLKILAGLDIADRLRPQDGRARVRVAAGTVDLRLSTLPAARGENVVLRLQAPEAAPGTFAALGFSAGDAARVAQLLDAREGLVLVTGPTGSGKTTTLYAALGRILARGGVNVVTVEDPVERRLPGVVQVQVNERTGLTFATALRAILRQDPDVVLVGEVRDRETAAIAAQAALTGHLVLATLHTIDAASAVTRLADVGVDPSTVAAALRGVVAQRLVRRLCASCRRARAAGWRDARLRGAAPEGEPCWAAPEPPTSCDACGGAGYRGRLALVEVLRAGGTITRRIAEGADAPSLAHAAHALGMTTLWESGAAAVRAGATSADELLRVLDPPADRAMLGASSTHATPFAEPARASGRVAERGQRSEGRDAATERGAAASAAAPLPDLDDTFELLPLAVRCRPPAPAPVPSRPPPSA